MTRTDVVDAIKAAGYVVSYREFTNSRNERLLAVDCAPDQHDLVAGLVNNGFPGLTAFVISRFPYADGNRVIVKGF